MVEGAGGRFLDAGIIGPPPRGAAHTNLYVSGHRARDLEQLIVFRFVASTELGKETPEDRDKARSGKDVVRLLAQTHGR